MLTDAVASINDWNLERSGHLIDRRLAGVAQYHAIAVVVEHLSDVTEGFPFGEPCSGGVGDIDRVAA